MKALAIGLIILYYYSFILYFQRIFPPKKTKHIQELVSMLIIVFTYLFLYKINMAWITMLTIMAIMTVSLRLTTGMDWLQALFGASLCVIGAYSFRGIIMSIMSFFFITDAFLYNDEIYYTITTYIMPLSLLFFAVLRAAIIPDNKLKVLLSNSVQLKHIVV